LDDRTTFEKSAEIPITVCPPEDVVGNYRISLEAVTTEQMRSGSSIFLVVKAIAPQPASGPIPDAMGLILGAGFVAAVGIALLRRTNNRHRGRRFRV
jgi:hypothetical protein